MVQFKFSTGLRRVAFALILSVICIAPSIAADPPAPIRDKDVLQYLEEVTAWHRDVLSLDTIPNNSLEIVQKSTLQANAAKVLQYAFDFARAQAKTLDAQAEVTEAADKTKETQLSQLVKAEEQLGVTIAALKDALEKVKAAIETRPARYRATLTIQREKLSGELKLAKARQDLLKSVLALSDTKEDEATGLTGKIENLERALPKADEAVEKDQPATDEPVKASKGILGISSEALAMYRQKSQLVDLQSQTQTMLDTNSQMVERLRDLLRLAIQRGDALNQATGAGGTQELSSQSKELDTLVGDFKALSSAVLPLGQIKQGLDNSMDNIHEWQESIDHQLRQDLRRILVRFAVLGVMILIPVVISQIAHRATLRYVHDLRRQRQLRITRRIIFSIVIAIVILLNFVTEFGSFATYIGLLTAGLAVALQNVILSLVSYFFFFGRFGVRVGDRVTVKNLVGEIVQVGLIRLYMMELDGKDGDFYPTGRIVSFPNSILFQPDSFGKQIPGSNYVWQEKSFVLEEGVDFASITKKLLQAVEVVYAEYGDIMKFQQMAITKTTHLNAKMPPPKGSMSFNKNGLSYVIRYPIERGRVSEINERITKKILETVQSDLSIELVFADPPRIQPRKVAAE